MNNTILAILHTLNILAFMTEMAVKITVRIIALAIVLGEYTWTGAQVVYNNRREILENVNIFRETVGSYFVYAWLTTICATCSSGTVNEHCAQNRVLYQQLRNSFMDTLTSMIPERTDYNGWTNYETWNVALWLQNDERMYNLVKGNSSYDFCIPALEIVFGQMTPDGVRWMDGLINTDEIDEMLKDLWQS